MKMHFGSDVSKVAECNSPFWDLKGTGYGHRCQNPKKVGGILLYKWSSSAGSLICGFHILGFNQPWIKIANLCSHLLKQ